jgi:hypothetical protein
VAVTIAVTNPCKGATISAITFNPTAIAVIDGATATSEFVVPGDTVDTANSLTGLCGTKTYTMSVNGSGASVSAWAAITDSTVTTGSKTLTINTLNYPTEITTATKAITIDVKTKFADSDYSTPETSTQIVVTISKAVCSCAAMAWTAPTISVGTVQLGATLELPTTQVSTNPYFPPPVSSDAAKSTNAAFNQCWADSTPCTTTGSYSTANIKYDAGSGKVALPGGWLAWNQSDQKLVVSPTLVSQAKAYPIYATYTSTSGTPTEFQVATLNVDCVVTSFTLPAAPTGAALTYTLWGEPKYFDFTQTWV